MPLQMQLPPREVLRAHAVTYGALFVGAVVAAGFVSCVIAPLVLPAATTDDPAALPAEAPTKETITDGQGAMASDAGLDGGDVGLDLDGAIDGDTLDGLGDGAIKTAAQRAPRDKNWAILQLGPRRFVVRLAQFEKRYGKANFGKARAVPHQKEGRMVGFKLVGVGRTLRRLGFREGDILTAINGKPITSPDAAITAYADIQNALPTKVNLRRRGRSMTLHYQIE
jgi:hypothetical protein